MKKAISMPDRRLVILVLWIAATLQGGCASMSEFSFLQKPPDQREPGDDDDSQWEKVGREARGNRPLEGGGEAQWFKDLTGFSAKGRSINRSLGYDDM